ncbi:MAG: hypothetical protein DRP08_07410 [Candidatus Aenigmatarchaeota archaeon]|nr:MAG: hypothetical protein DRP08_07410 [Candidatus Aenigmarchaeota archaeon]
MKKITLKRLKELNASIDIINTEDEFKTGEWELITEDGRKDLKSDELVENIKLFRKYKELIIGVLNEA